MAISLYGGAQPQQQRRKIPAVGQQAMPSTMPDTAQPIDRPLASPGTPATTATKRDLIPDGGGYQPAPVTPTGGGDPGQVPTGATGRAPQVPPTNPRPLTTGTTTMAPKPGGVITEGSGFVPPPRPAGTPTAPRPPLLTPNVPGASVTPYGPEGDLRGGMIAPAESERAKAAAGMTGTAANTLAGFDYPKAVGSYADSYLNRLAVNPVQFQGVDSNVTGSAINPNVDYRSVGTDVTRRAVDPRVDFTGVNPDVTREKVNPLIDFQKVDTNLTAGDTIRPEDSPDLQAFRAQRSTAAGNIANGPSRSEIAQNALKAFDLANQPGYENKIRSVGQQAAKFGRLGMGETALETMRPFTELQAQRAALEKQLAADTATGEIQDRLNNLNAASGLVGQEEAFGAGRRAELRGERGYQTDIASQNIERGIGERDTSMGLAERNQARTAQEADTQANLAAQNIARQQQERDTALGLSERNVGRDLGLSAEDAALAERNLGRQVGERNTEADLAGQNISRAMQNRDFATGLSERNVGRAQSERNTALGVASENTNREADIRRAALEAGMGTAGQENATNLSRFGALSGYEGDILNREAGQRDELRGERGFQQGMSQQATENALRERQQGNSEQQQAYENAIRELALGYGVDPTAAYLGASNTAANQAGQGWQGASDALTWFLANQRKQQGG